MLPCHAQFHVQFLEVAEQDVVLNEYEVLVVWVVFESGFEDFNVGMEDSLEVTGLWAIQMVLVEFLAYSCSNGKYLIYKLVVNSWKENKSRLKF